MPDTSWSNAMGYYTPDFGGLSGRFVYALGEASDSNASNNAVAMLYLDKGPLTASVAFQRTRTGPAITKASWAQSVLAAGVAYDISVAKLFLQYDGTRTSGVSLSTDTVQLGATIPMLSGKFMLSVVQTSIRAANQPDIRRRDAGIGYLYAFSRRTDAYATSLYDKLSDRGSGFTTAIGLRHKF
ncbi:porin [Cupriavidus lacunae]|nr:porin [Cupriavidus lacunae]